MPNWGEILNEVRASGHTTDVIRRRYLRKLHQVTKRNVIINYSGWLQKKALPRAAPPDFGINETDYAPVQFGQHWPSARGVPHAQLHLGPR